MKKKKVLVIAAHMDDEVLGCGATIARHISEGDTVSVCFVAGRVYNHKFNEKRNEIEARHALKAKAVLGYQEPFFLGLNDERLDSCLQDIIIPLEKYILKLRPDTAYCPFQGDNNQDHRAVFNAARVVLRPCAAPFVNELYMYEVSSSTEQSPPLAENAFLPNYYVDITKYINTKLKAFRCYKTERRKFPHPRCQEALINLAQKRGIEIGFEYAEGFMTIRRKWS